MEDDDEICQVLEKLNKKFDSKKDIFQFNKNFVKLCLNARITSISNLF